MENTIGIIAHTLTLEFTMNCELDSFNTEFARVSCVPLFRPTRTHVRVQATACSADEIFALVIARAHQVAAQRADFEGAFQESEETFG